MPGFGLHPRGIDRERAVSALAVALVHAALGWALLTGLGVSIPDKAQEVLETFNVVEPPPPARTAAASAAPAHRARAEKGGGRRAAEPEVARDRDRRAQDAGADSAAGRCSGKAGRRARPPPATRRSRGPGTGAGGIGNGTGSGRYGNGPGGGGGGGGPLRLISGADREFGLSARSVTRRARRPNVGLRFVVRHHGSCHRLQRHPQQRQPRARRDHLSPDHGAASATPGDRSPRPPDRAD